MTQAPNLTRAWRASPGRSVLTNPARSDTTTATVAARRLTPVTSVNVVPASNPVNSPPPRPVEPTDRPVLQHPHQPDPAHRAVHIRDVPEPIWRHARQVSLESGLSFKAFVIQLLATCEPSPTSTID